MKLIRDKIHEMVEDKDRVFQAEHMNLETMQEWLKMKLQEEAGEVRDAKPAEVLEELADVYEVLLALGAAYGHDIQAIQALADWKREERGGFREGWFYRG